MNDDKVAPFRRSNKITSLSLGLIERFLKGEKILLESTADISLESLKNTPLVIAYATQRRRDELMEEAKANSMSSCALKEPSFYLSSKKLAERLAQDEIPGEETAFFLKMALWQSETKTGDREEISLEREEYGLFDLVADHEASDVFWKNAIKETASNDIILIHQCALTRSIMEMKELTQDANGKPRSLIIIEASKLEDSFTNAERQKFTESRLRPYFGEKAALLFGLLGIFFERFSDIDAGGFRGNVILKNSHRESVEWQRFWAALENLPSNDKYGHKKDELMKYFSPRENEIAWVSSYANEISFQSVPNSLAQFFQKAVAPFERILLQSKALSGDGSFKLMRKLFELDSAWQEVKIPLQENESAFGNLEIKMLPDFPEPYSEGYFKRCHKLFLELIAQEGGGCLFLVSSKKTVAALYQSMLPSMPKDTKLLAVGPTGGVGKSVALFKENPKRAALIVTNQILPHLPEIEDHLRIIAFQKLPFDPPDDPIFAARSKQFKSAFNEYTLPRAIMRFRELLAELGGGNKNADQPKGSATTNPAKKICYLLDSRLLNREYGRLFI